MKYQFQDVIYEFDNVCLATFEKCRQRTCVLRENGGQLFAKFLGDKIVIEIATITRGNTKRSRFGFWPDRLAERQDIQALFDKGLHYIGDWHTHPESTPAPSASDRIKMIDIFQRSNHELKNMLMVIVGLASFPEGLFVGSVMDECISMLLPKYEEP